MHEIGTAQTFLGIQINQCLDGSIQLHQDQYIDKLIQEFDILKPRSTPTIPIRIKHEAITKPNPTDAKPCQIERIQRIIGSLYYIANNTRPDIAKATHSLSTHTRNPTTAHVTAAEQILQYLDATRHLCIKFTPQTASSSIPVIHAVTDASYADAPDYRSSQGLIIFFNGTPVIWQLHY